MSTVLVLAAAALVSWTLRVLFITVVPATRLPDPVRRALDHAAPAVLAAVVATALTRPSAELPTGPAVLALAAGALVAWRTRRALAATVTAIAAFALLTL
jgi:branched-subunit amino acid transport protein